MDTQLASLLKEYGLDENEIEVYLILVGKKELTAYNISKKTKIHRSTCYDILERLIKKGFVKKEEIKGKSYYSPNEISRILSDIKNKETLLLSIIPSIQALEKKQETTIRFLEGSEGQKEFNFRLLDLSRSKKINYVYVLDNFYSPSLSSILFIERVIKEFVDKKLGKNVEFRGLWNPNFNGTDVIKTFSSLGENRFLDGLPSKVSIIIYGDRVAFLYTLDKPYVIDIKSGLLAEEFKTLFEIYWKLADKKN